MSSTPTAESLDLLDLTEADHREFADRGYWISPKLFNDEEVDALRNAVMRYVRDDHDRQTPIWRGVRRVLDPASPSLIQGINGWWVNDAIRQAVLSPRIGYIGAQFMRTDVVRLWHDQVIYKPPAGDKADQELEGNVGWHQDASHWQAANTTNFVTAWIALQDTDLSNGGMRTIVGSHKWGLFDDAYTFGEKNLDALRERFEAEGRGAWIDEPCILPAGCASFHHALTFHGSGPNLSDQPRLSLISHMMPADCGFNPEGRYHVNVDFLGPDAIAGQLFAGPYFPTLWPLPDREHPVRPIA